MKNRAVIMDRDGTIFRDSHYLSSPGEVEIYKGVIPALRRLKAKGWKLIIGSNQSGIGRGYFTKETVDKIHDRFLGLCRSKGLTIDEIYFCPHQPGDRCGCRKPKTGMLRQAARDFKLDLKACVIVGDKKCDIDWGCRAKAKTILVMTGYGKQSSKTTRSRAHHVSKSLAQAADWILENVY